MGTAKDAKLMKESFPQFFDFTEATDSGDHTVFTVTGKTVFSDRNGYSLEVKPDGVVTGRIMLTPHTSNDTVTAESITVSLAGVESLIASEAVTITRPASDVAKINSVTVDESGDVVVVAGTDGSTTTFSETRGAAGGPPFIPVGSVERGQVRVTNSVAAPITAAEIYQSVGDHVERFDAPNWKIRHLGLGDKATTPAQRNAHIEMKALIGDPIHTGSTYRKVYVKGYSATFVEVSNSVDFKPAQNSYSLTSEEVYGDDPIGSPSQTLGQAGFKALMNNGISDEIVADEGDNLVFKFYPHKLQPQYSLTQGILGQATTNPVKSQISAACTITAAKATVNFSS